MFDLIYKYLMLHQQVCIPGFGRLYKDRQPATHDFASTTFHPPVHQFAFKEEAVAADKQFYAYLSKERGVDEVEAIRSFSDFAYQLKQQVRKHNQVELPGIGVLHYNTDGYVVLKDEPLLQSFFQPVPAERVIRENVEHTLLVGDSQRTNTEMQVMLEDEEPTKKKGLWWLFAILLGLLAVAAVVYYYIQHGSIRL